MVKEILWTLLSSMWKFGEVVFTAIKGALQIPTSPYGLVKFIAENNIVFFNNEELTKAFFFIIPLIVSHVIGYLPTFIKRADWRISEVLSIALYALLIYLFSSVVFWIVVGSIIAILITVYIIYKVKTNRATM